MLRYDISPLDPEAHLYIVAITLPEPKAGEEIFRLPTWINGSYLIRDFAGNIQKESARLGGKPVAIEKIDKTTWRVITGKPKAGAELQVFYEVWAFDPSVRTAYLDECRGFFNPGCVFMESVGRREEKITVTIREPEDAVRAEQTDWKVATSLKRAKGTARFGWGTYEAADYDELIDSPVEMGDFTVLTVKPHGVRHDIVFSDLPINFDAERTAADIEALCAREIEFFEPETHKSPVKEYTFLVNVTANGYGGLEHRASSVLQIPAKCLPSIHDKERTENYVQFLGLVAHEYFHTWNVKRLKPAEFVGIDFSHEVTTELLWLFEGFTSYYDDLMLRRAGFVDDKGYAKLLTVNFKAVLETHARTVQSLSEASFDTWVKFYKPNANSANASVSYYKQGALAALTLDAELRHRTKCKKSLDDVMRYLWTQYRTAGKKYRGETFASIAAAFEAVAGVSFEKRLAELTRTTAPIDYEKALKPLGLTLTATERDKTRSLLGLSGKGNDAGFTVRTVFDQEAGQWAGISSGDLLIAVDGVRIKNDNLNELLARYGEGDEMVIHAFRDDALLVWAILIGKETTVASTVNLDKPTTLGKAWLEG